MALRVAENAFLQGVDPVVDRVEAVVEGVQHAAQRLALLLVRAQGVEELAALSQVARKPSGNSAEASSSSAT